MEHVPGYVKDFLRNLPDRWDDVQFIDGYPGKFIVLQEEQATNGISPGSMQKTQTER